MGHIILLGDSIFDNGVYVPGHPDVVKQLCGVLPEGWTASLLAVDGAVTRSVPSQLTRIPHDATHLVVSVGGNDALGESHILSSSVRMVGEGVAVLADAQERFARNYADMLRSVLALELPTALCTIYDTPPSAPNHRIIRTALAVFNDVITRAAFGEGTTADRPQADLQRGRRLRQSDRTLGPGRHENGACHRGARCRRGQRPALPRRRRLTGLRRTNQR
jgi:hypothetical protein